MRDAIKGLAKAAVTGLIKPDDLVVQAGHKAVDLLFSWLPGPQKGKLDALIARVEDELEQLAEAEFKGRADLDQAIGNATMLFEVFGLTATELVDLNLKPAEATRELLERGKQVLDAAGEAVAGLCRGRIVPRVYRHLLGDPQTIAELSPAVTRALLSQREAIAKIPDEVGCALRRMLGRHLVIDPTEVWRQDLSDIYLFRAEYGVVPFHEQRQPDVDRLLAWCEADTRMAVRVITGAGGTGKTRLMIELCRQARLRRWRAGFLHRETPATPSWELDGLVDGEQPVLLVVDYTETQRDVLVPVLRRLDHSSSKTRVILVARALSDWLPDLRRADPKLQELLDATRVEVEELSAIALPVEQRLQIVEAAAAAFADRLVVTGLRRGRRRPAPTDLGASHLANALFLHIAAFAAAVGDPAKEEDALLRFVLVREERHWHAGLVSAGLAQELDVSSVAQAHALIVLAGGAEDKAGARRLLERVPNLSGLTPPKHGRLIDLLHRLYPGERYLEPLRPDLLGEELVDRVLDDDPALLRAALDSVSREQAHSGLTVLTRLAKRRRDAERWLEQALAGDLERLAEPAIQIAIETGHPMGKVLAQALEKQPLEEPSRLEPLIPKKTIELLDVGVVVMTQQWDRIQAIPKPWGDHIKSEAARVANNLAVRLSEVGQRQAALALAQEAADLYRGMAAMAPDAYRPGLAGALNNLAAFLREVGQRQEALAPAQEAADLYRELAAKAPDAYRPDLASVLNTLANSLSEVGQREAALAPAKEAVVIRRDLAAKAPDAWRPALAGALDNLATSLSEVGHRQAALAPAQEAVAIRRELAAKAPDAYRPALAMALKNLAIRLSEVGQREAALASAQEAANIYRELAAKAPDAYRPDLAGSLAVLANRLEENGDLPGALERNREAISVYRPYFLAQPAAFAHWMAPMYRLYVERCEKLGCETDEELLAPIVEVARRVQGDPGGEA